MSKKPVKFYNTLSPQKRERLFFQMRRIDRELHFQYATAHYHYPVQGETGIGGKHIDHLVKAVALDGLLRGLRAGKSINKSLQMGIEDGRGCIRKWNEKREYQVHRWVDCHVAYVTNAANGIRRMINTNGG